MHTIFRSLSAKQIHRTVSPLCVSIQEDVSSGSDRGAMKLIETYRRFSSATSLHSRNDGSPQCEDDCTETKTDWNQFKTSSSRCLPPAPPHCSDDSLCTKIQDSFVNCKTQEQPVWKGCDKICMPCCCPARGYCPDAKHPRIQVNKCKKVEHRIPAFSECRKEPIPERWKKECCYTPEHECIPVRHVEPLIRTKVRQEMLLGRKPK